MIQVNEKGILAVINRHLETDVKSCMLDLEEEEYNKVYNQLSILTGDRFRPTLFDKETKRCIGFNIGKVFISLYREAPIRKK